MRNHTRALELRAEGMSWDAIGLRAGSLGPVRTGYGQASLGPLAIIGAKSVHVTLGPPAEVPRPPLPAVGPDPRPD